MGANDIELPQHVTDALISDDPGGSGVKVIRYRAELWCHFTDEDKERCLAYWRRMYCIDYTHLVVITEPDEADMLFADAEQTIVYQENMKRKPKSDFAEKFVEYMTTQPAREDAAWLERNVLVRLLAKLFKGNMSGDHCIIDIPGIGRLRYAVTNYDKDMNELFDGLPLCMDTKVIDAADMYKRIITYARS